MKKFSQIITEARKSAGSVEMLSTEINDYLTKVNRQLPALVKKIIYLTQKYNLVSAEQIEKIRTSKKGDLNALVNEFNIPRQDIEDLHDMLGQIKKDLKMLPQYQTAAEREAVSAGKLSMDDLTIDLKTSTGRNAVAKMYYPMVLKIVNQYIGKCRLDKAALISAGLAGLTDAMNEWKPDDENAVPFKTYAGYRIKQQILNDINKYSHALSGTSWYSAKEYGASLLDAISIDGLPKDSDGDFKQDHLVSLGIQDEPKGDEEKAWEQLYKLLEKTFNQRDCDIFYRFFGLNGRKREKSKDIAKSYNMSEGNIRNSILNKMLKWLKTNDKAAEILQDIQDIYTESLMSELINLSREQIIGRLSEDDTYILLEELNRWRNKDVFKSTLEQSLSIVNEPEILNMIKGDFNTIDSGLKKHKKSIILFLTNMYPAEAFYKKSDVSILEYMLEIQKAYKKFKL